MVVCLAWWGLADTALATSGYLLKIRGFRMRWMTRVQDKLDDAAGNIRQALWHGSTETRVPSLWCRPHLTAWNDG